MRIREIKVDGKRYYQVGETINGKWNNEEHLGTVETVLENFRRGKKDGDKTRTLHKV